MTVAHLWHLDARMGSLRQATERWVCAHRGAAAAASAAHLELQAEAAHDGGVQLGGPVGGAQHQDVVRRVGGQQPVPVLHELRLQVGGGLVVAVLAAPQQRIHLR